MLTSQLTFTFLKLTIETLGCEICSKLTLKHQNDVSDVVLLFLLLILLTIVDFDQVMLAGLSFETNEYKMKTMIPFSLKQYRSL